MALEICLPGLKLDFYLGQTQLPGGRGTICLRDLCRLGNSLSILALSQYSMMENFLPCSNFHMQITGHAESSSVPKQESREERASVWVLAFCLHRLDSQGSVKITYGHMRSHVSDPHCFSKVVWEPDVSQELSCMSPWLSCIWSHQSVWEHFSCIWCIKFPEFSVPSRAQLTKPLDIQGLGWLDIPCMPWFLKPAMQERIPDLQWLKAVTNWPTSKGNW